MMHRIHLISISVIRPMIVRTILVGGEDKWLRKVMGKVGMNKNLKTVKILKMVIR